ncbi:hypothetical protein G6F43_007396 [Rhizopus delemar]|nr:hypothetical protein G6F43_007396 [Rhizopus delemar]
MEDQLKQNQRQQANLLNPTTKSPTTGTSTYTVYKSKSNHTTTSERSRENTQSTTTILCYSRRWNSTRRQADTILQELDEHNLPPTAIINHKGQISNPIYNNTNRLDIIDHKFKLVCT